MRTSSLIEMVIMVGVGLMAGRPACCASSDPQTINATPARYGLTVANDGVLMKDGRPYRGIGVNYFHAFLRHLQSPNDKSYEVGFKGLATAKIPFARLIGCGFYPSEQKLYQENPQGILPPL